MCATCEQATKLPKGQALKLIGDEMKRVGWRKCLDLLVGKLVGIESPERNLDAEEQWERNRG